MVIVGSFVRVWGELLKNVDGRGLKFSEVTYYWTRTKWWWNFEYSSQGKGPLESNFWHMVIPFDLKVTKFDMVILRRGEGFHRVAACPNFWRDPLLSLLTFDRIRYDKSFTGRGLLLLLLLLLLFRRSITEVFGHQILKRNVIQNKAYK